MTHTTYVSRVFLLVFAGFLFAVMPLLAQTYVLMPESEMTVDGTSNTGDWNVTATKLTGGMTLQMQDDAPPSLETVQVTVLTEEIKGRNLIMTKNMAKTLKVKEHKEITYALKEVTEAQSTEEGFTLATLGDLAIGGVTKEVAMTVTGSMDSDGQVHLTGSHTFVMSDYNLTGRRFMFGRFVLADEVTVNYIVKFAPEG